MRLLNCKCIALCWTGVWDADEMYSLLFCFTTLAFVYYFHCHLAGVHAPGITQQKAEGPAAAEMGAATGTAPGTTGTAGAPEEHQMQSIPYEATTNGAGNHGAGIPAPPTSGGYGNTTQTSNPLYPESPTRPAREGGYGGYANGSNQGYGAETTRP